MMENACFHEEKFDETKKMCFDLLW